MWKIFKDLDSKEILEMNGDDEYWFWLMKAIMESDAGHFYCYDKNKLFSYAVNSNAIEPMYRNDFTRRNRNVQNQLSYQIEKAKLGSAETILLPRLSDMEKKDFLSLFMSKITNEAVKKKLSLEIESFTDKSCFLIKADLKSIDQQLYIDFDLEWGKFLVGKIKELYEPLGIGANSQVIW